MSGPAGGRKIILPEIVPVFPLPNVVFFPSTVLPLHIFEPRYRKMVATALETDRLIVMTLLRPGSESEYLGNPPIFPVGCVGQIVDATKLPDGRYEIVLTGIARVEIEEEIAGEEFRRARARVRPEERAWIESEEAGPRILSLLESFEAIRGNVQIIAAGLDIAGEPVAREITLNTMALHLNAAATTRQKLLEMDDLAARAELLGRILARSSDEMRVVDRFRNQAPDDPRVN